MTRSSMGVALIVAAIAVAAAGLDAPGARAAEFQLMPSPQTVHIGYFSAALKPVLTINSGDIVTIETVGGPDPAEVDASGVMPPSAVPDYARAIRNEVKDRGPGPHILTGPIYVNGAMPGDVLELRILDVDFALPYGFNTQRPYTGALPDEFPGFFQRIIPINREKRTAQVAPGVVVPVPQPFFGVMGVAPLPSMGRISSGPPVSTPVTWTTRTSSPGPRSTCRSMRQARCFRPAMPMPARATARSISLPSKPGCAGASNSSSART